MARYEDPASARGAACGRLDANGSVIDWRRGIRGAVSPCPDVDTDEQCRQLADRIERKGSGHYLYATIPVLVASGHRAEVSPSAYGEEAR
ncbi:hypothetical protein ACNQR7_30630 [Mycolicibacterium senegalense]|uniref:hypothetical protein n=1 Tax=Mycobacteriaceae TaxID=1762 RepID=UPI003AADB1FE